jgi:hypothetical protein
MNPFTTTNTLSRKLAGFLVAALVGSGAMLLSGCFVSENPSAPPVVAEREEVAVKIRMGVGSVNSLRKSSVITLDNLVITLSSSSNDTIRDTITSSTTPSLNPVSTTGQTILKNYTLTALRSWKIVVVSRDALDSVIHRDSSTIPALYAGDTAVVNLNLSSRFTMYEARFLTLPDSIQSATPSQPKQELCINRLVLKIDGVAVRDSTSSPCFDSLATHTLAYDYVAIGNRNVEMVAYGPMNYWPIDSALFRGDTDIDVGSGIDSTVSLNLSWVGPTTGVGSIEVDLGKVGKVTVNGTLPGTVFP